MGWFPLFSASAQNGWSSDPLGPGGFISGLAFHADGTKVLRTDTSGAWKWNASTSRWDMLVTTATMPAGEAIPRYGANPGCYEIEIAKSNSSYIYMMWRYYVWKSVDQGASFTKTDRAVDTFEPNDDVRGANKKLAIDPINEDVVICGGPLGVSITDDGGDSWTTISTSQIPAATDAVSGNSAGYYLFAFYENGGATDGKTDTIYCASSGNGVYKSTDGGLTWALAGTGGPLTFMHMKVSSTGKVYVIRHELDLEVGITPNVLILTGSTWAAEDTGTGSSNLRGVAINPSDPDHIVVTNEKGNISVSLDAGDTWSGFGTHYLTATEIQWIENLYDAVRTFDLQPGGTLEFDPSVSDTLYLGEGLGIVKGPAPTGVIEMQWADTSVGLEQLCIKRLIKPTGGQLVAAVMDQGVFRINGTTYPSDKGIVPYFGAGWDVDWCPTDPLTIIAGINTGHAPGPVEQSGLSRDGGASWDLFTSDVVDAGGRGAMMACGIDPDNFIYVKSANGADPCRIGYTLDGGVTWDSATIPDVDLTGNTGWNNYWLWNKHVLAGDRVAAPGTFYAYNYGDGTSVAGVYRSVNKGVDWTRVYTGTLNLSYGNSRLQSVPEREGHLFAVSGMYGFTPDTYATGIQRSTDGGASWTTVANTFEAYALGFGAPLVPGGYPTVFFAGWLDPGKVYGIYMSTDECETWTKIGDFPHGCFDTVNDITGDMDEFGVCYVGTYASGIFKYTP